MAKNTLQEGALYELMVILSPDLSEKDHHKELDTIREAIAAEGGKIENEDIWGMRDLAYKINKASRGFYAVMSFILTDLPKVNHIERDLRLSPAVIRHLITRAPRGYVFKTLTQYEEEAAKAKEEEEKKKSEGEGQEELGSRRSAPRRKS